MTRFAELLRCLAEQKVEFILIGGVAAVAHGSPKTTQGLDLVYRRTPENIRRLVSALEPLEPYLRGAAPGLPFSFDQPTIQAGLNFTLTTSMGWIDLLGEVTGGGTFDDLIDHSQTVEIYGFECRILTLDALIRTKRAAGRIRDIEAIAILEDLRDRKPRA